MNPPPDPTADPLEDAMAAALDALESGGPTALEAFLAGQPHLAPRLRAALGELQRADLLQPPASALPTTFGDFELGPRLGAGGMGVVHGARQRSLGRDVALKIVRPELLFFDGARERFRREIEAVARLEHPAIVPILASGEQDGVPWYAMPRLRGRSAEALVQALAANDLADPDGATVRAQLADDEPGPPAGSTFAGPWWRTAVRFVVAAAHGIAHAHARGVLHRDLKPSNLWLCADGRAIVLDFGLALARGDARLTRTGSQAGSPAYMAPEQLRGEPADERTDVYGLAATLHCLLGRRAPFPLGDPEALRARILAGQRLDLPPDLPLELRTVVDAAMDVERTRRHADAAAFADDLLAVLEGRPIRARALPLPVRARRFAARHRALTAAAAVSLGFAALLPAALWRQQRAANVELAALVARADRSASISVDAVEHLLAEVAVDKLRNLPAVQAVAANLLQDALALFDRLADDPAQHERVAALRLDALDAAARLAASLGRPTDARAFAQRLLDLTATSPPPRERLRRAAAQRLLVWLDHRAGRDDRDADLAARLDAVRTELQSLASAPDPLPPAAIARERAVVEQLAAALAAARGDSAAAERALRAALAAAASIDGFVPEFGQAAVALAALLQQGGQRDEAARWLDTATTRLRAAAPPEAGWPVPRMLEAMFAAQRASLAFDAKDHAAARSHGNAALALLDALARDYPEEPAVLRQRGFTSNLVAVSLHATDDFAAARPLLEQAVRDELAVLARDPADQRAAQQLAMHRRGLSVNLRGTGDWRALAQVARELGAMPGGADLPGRAARDLLRCAAEAAAPDALALRDEALALLERAVGLGLRLTADDPVYAPVRDDPRFTKLLGGPAK